MTNRLTTIAALLMTAIAINAQTFVQYFDNIPPQEWEVEIPYVIQASEGNVWQVGQPQKTMLNEADTEPNAIITDTLLPYPPDNFSSFVITIPSDNWWGGILAIQWKQKYDFEFGSDGGLIEYSVDDQQTWQSVFNDPNVYNFYGFDPLNVMPVCTGEYAFSSRDTSWQDIWLCFDQSWLSQWPNTHFRFTLISDDNDDQNEGWLIDNIMVHITQIHTAKEVEIPEYLRVYPTATNGIVNIEAEKQEGYHIIENMQLFDSEGKVVQEFGRAPTKYFIDISHLPDGVYYLRINTNLNSMVFPVVLAH